MSEQDAAETDAGAGAEGDADSGGSDAAEQGTGAGETEATTGETLTGAVTAVETDPDDDLVAAVADADPEPVAGELAALSTRIERLEEQVAEHQEEVEDLESRLARKQADFQNYKKRQEEKLAEVRERATEDLVERLVDVRDNLRRALDQDEDADIRPGIESTLAQFDEELDRENVEVLDPEPGEETDPVRHEVLMQVESDRPEGTVVDVHRPGYEMAGKVLRTAQVTVSDGSGRDGAGGDGDGN